MYKRKHKKAPEFVIDKVDAAIKLLSEHSQPENLGDLKHGWLNGIRAYELGRKNRLLYEINRDSDQIEIILHKVCSHEETYGK